MFKAVASIAKSTGTCINVLYSELTESEVWHLYYASLENAGVEVMGDVERVEDAGYNKEDLKKLTDITAGLMI